jgi:hypothetical protein
VHAHVQIDLELREHVEQHRHDDDAAPDTEQSGDEPREQTGRQQEGGERESRDRGLRVVQSGLQGGASMASGRRGSGRHEDGATRGGRKPRCAGADPDHLR